MESIWDQLARWLSQYTAAQQLLIMLGAAVAVLTMLLWVTR